MATQLKTFIIYARDDKSHKDLLLRHLKPLIASSVISVWHDGDILPGEDWEKAIKTNIKSSDLVLVLVSVNSINSDFIQTEELTEALGRFKDGLTRIIPIIVDPCIWSVHPVFKGLQGLPDNMRPISSWNNLHEAWTNVVTRLYEMSLEILEESERRRLIALEEDKKRIEAENRQLAKLEAEKKRAEEENRRLAKLEAERMHAEEETQRITTLEAERQRLAKEAEGENLVKVEKRRLDKLYGNSMYHSVPKYNTKKDSIWQKFREWLTSDFTSVIVLGGLLMFFTGIFFNAFSRTHLDKQESFNYTDLNTQIDEFKKEINFKSQQLRNSNQYEETIKFLQENQKKIDSLSQLSWISPDSLKHSREQMDEIRTSYKARIVSDRDSLLKGVDFDSGRTSLLLNACRDLGLDKSQDTMNLMRFQMACIWVSRSNDIINGINLNITDRNETINNLRYIETSSKFLFLTDDQKTVIRNYRKVLIIMGQKVYANADDILAGMINHYSSGERHHISDFLKSRKNK